MLNFPRKLNLSKPVFHNLLCVFMYKKAKVLSNYQNPLQWASQIPHFLPCGSVSPVLSSERDDVITHSVCQSFPT